MTGNVPAWFNQLTDHLMDRRSFLNGSVGLATALPLAGCDQSVRKFGIANTYSVACSPDGGSCLSGSGDGSLALWDLKTGRELRRLQADGLAVNTVAYSPDGLTALSGDNYNRVTLWDVGTGRRIRNLWDENIALRTGEPNAEPHSQWAHFASVRSVVFSPDGRTALTGSAASGNEDAVLKLWD